jgi:hypothetical protein
VFQWEIRIGGGQILHGLSAPTADDPDDRSRGALTALDFEALAVILMVSKES